MRPMLLGVLAGTIVLAGCGTFNRSISSARAEGNTAYAEGNYELALDRYQEVVTRKPHDAEDRYKLGRTLMSLDRAHEAREQFEVASELEPKNRVYWIALLDSLHTIGRTEEMLVLVEQRLRERGDWEDASALGVYLNQAGLKDEADTAFARAVELGGRESPDPHIARARFYRSVGDRGRELESLRRVLYFDLENDTVNARIRELGQVPGPSLAIVPE